MKITEPQDPQFATVLEAKLLQELIASSTQAKKMSFSLALTCADGASLGGLSASTSYGWLLIKVLFIAPSVRGRGYGREVLQQAFARAKSLGCHSVWLDTSNPAARRFYVKQGFESFGTLINDDGDAPLGHQRRFMKRKI